jgi:hypothetical protein
MINFRHATAALALGLVVATTATPTLAKSRATLPGHAARAQAIEGMVGGGVSVSPDRARSLHECTTLAAPFGESTWGNTESDIYRSCMARHGQPE